MIELKLRKISRFRRVMLIYAAAFLTAAGIALIVLWGFLQSYERSVPASAMKAYTSQLTAEKLLKKSGILDKVDTYLQDEDECLEQIDAAISKELSYDRDADACTLEQQSYTLYSGAQAIGSVTLRAGLKDRFGLSAWNVESERFDFSFLLGEPVSVTVPEGYSVVANGRLLGAGYITDDKAHFALLEEFYGDYTLPTMLTYTAGGCLGEIGLEVTDPKGNAVAVTEDTDWSFILDNCTAAEKTELSNFSNGFIIHYVRFSSSDSDTAMANFTALQAYLVSGGELSQRLRSAIAGLKYGQSRSDKVVELTMNHAVRLDDSHFVCDVTYLVDTAGQKGVVQTMNNMKIAVVKSSKGLRAEAIYFY